MEKKIPVILDTDIGGDIDDVLALGFALNSPELDLRAVTTVNTDPAMRARIAAKMLQVFGRSDVVVAPGQMEMFDGSPTWCKDINGAVVVTLDDPVPEGNGVQTIIDTARAHPGEAVLIGIGCWTNVARAFQRDQDLVKIVSRLVLMGGLVDPPGPESNIRCDPSAAGFVLDLPVPKLLVPLNVTRRCIYRLPHHKDLFRTGTPQTNLVRDLIRAWQIGRHRGSPVQEPVLHDPLAVALAFDSSLIRRSEPMRITVERVSGTNDGITRPVENDAPNAEVVMDVDVERFEALFARRILGPEGPR